MLLHLQLLCSSLFCRLHLLLQLLLRLLRLPEERLSLLLLLLLRLLRLLLLLLLLQQQLLQTRPGSCGDRLCP